MAEYKSRYDKEKEKAMADIASDGGFSYSPESDPAYRQYAAQYAAQAERGMKNTLAESSALTGGYANSYALTAAQREYDRISSQLGDVIPELYDAAYSRWRDRLDDKYRRLDALADLESADYSRWRDSEDDRVKMYLSSEDNRTQREIAAENNQTRRDIADRDREQKEQSDYRKYELQREKNANDYRIDSEKNRINEQNNKALAKNRDSELGFSQDKFEKEYLLRRKEYALKKAKSVYPSYSDNYWEDY